MSSGSSSASSSAATGSGSTAGATASGCPTGTAGSFTFSSGGDVNIQDLWQKNLLPAFAKACPNISVTLDFDTHSSNANLLLSKVAAAIKTGADPGVDLTEDFGDTAAQAGLTEILTPTDVPAISSLNKQALAAYGNAAIPYRGSSVLLAYDSSKITSPPKSLADLLTWITAHPGQFTYNDPATGGSGGSFVETVVDSTTPAADLTKMQTDYVPALEPDWTAGLAKLKSLTPSIYQKVYPKGNQAVLDLLAQGEISMAPVWSDQFLSAQSQGQLGPEYKVTQIADPTFNGGAAYMAIIKGSKHKAAAATFLQWVLEPAQQAVIVKDISGFPAIPLDSLPTNARGAFDGIETQNLRPGLDSKLSSDLQSKWATVVPG